MMDDLDFEITKGPSLHAVPPTPSITRQESQLWSMVLVEDGAFTDVPELTFDVKHFSCILYMKLAPACWLAGMIRDLAPAHSSHHLQSQQQLLQTVQRDSPTSPVL